MKQLKITIAGEVKTFDLPENGEYKCEVTESYVPKEGDCVMVKCKETGILYWYKITDTTTIFTDYKLSVNSRSEISKNGSFYIYEKRIYTKITPEELKAKYAEAGYDWDYNTDTIKPIKWVPKAGDCVRVGHRDGSLSHWFKIAKVTTNYVIFDLNINSNLRVLTKGYYSISDSVIYTKITPEELKAKYAEAGFDWDYETDMIKPIKWVPKDGDEVWLLNIYMKPIFFIFDEDNSGNKILLDKGLFFQTEEECQKFADHCMEYIK